MNSRGQLGCGRIRTRVIALAVPALLLACAIRAGAQGFTTPLHIGASQSIRDESGSKLRGNWTNVGDLVQILWVSNGVINPPAFDGTPDANNPLLDGGATGIGAQTDPALSDEGIFGKSLTLQRPGDSAKIFVRAFNAKDLLDASFYGDSQIFTVKGNAVFDAVIGATTNPIDPRDFDFDGLNNSREKSLGSRPDNPDSDRDGYDDGDELVAGTGLLDPNSYLAITEVIKVEEGNVILDWYSVTGRQYVVQFAAEDLRGDPAYTNITPVMDAALGTNVTTTVITNGLELGRGHFRIWVLGTP